MSAEAVPVFDPTQKKKKKKPTAAVPAQATAAPAAPAATAEPAPAAEPTMDFGKKKKKKPAAAATTTTTTAEVPAAPAADAEKTATATATESEPWAGSDRDYTYKELLTRMFDILRKTNPDFGSRSATIFLKPPILGREGKKTIWFNFAEICALLRRKPEHMMAFVFAELGTSGSLDGSQRLVVRGRYMPKHMETIIKKYIKEYVVCNTCNKLNTALVKENRLTFVVCNECSSRRSVTAIKKGFEAQVTRRKHA